MGVCIRWYSGVGVIASSVSSTVLFSAVGAAGGRGVTNAESASNGVGVADCHGASLSLWSVGGGRGVKNAESAPNGVGVSDWSGAPPLRTAELIAAFGELRLTRSSRMVSKQPLSLKLSSTSTLTSSDGLSDSLKLATTFTSPSDCFVLAMETISASSAPSPPPESTVNEQGEGPTSLDVMEAGEDLVSELSLIESSFPPTIGGPVVMETGEDMVSELSSTESLFPPTVGGLAMVRVMEAGEDMESELFPPTVGGLAMVRVMEAGEDMVSELSSIESSFPPTTGGLVVMEAGEDTVSELSSTELSFPPTIGVSVVVTVMEAGEDMVSELSSTESSFPPTVGGLVMVKVGWVEGEPRILF